MHGMDLEEPWRPLSCEHRGPDRIALTPLVVHSKRTDGGPRQEVLARLPTIRSCCLADRFARAAWWYEVDRTFGSWREGGYGRPRDDVRRFEGELRKALLAGVPAATRAGVRDFAAYRLLKEREHEGRERAAEAAWAAAEAARLAEEIRGEEERFRAEQERLDAEFWRLRAEYERLRADEERARGGRTAGATVSPECLDVLGLPRDASPEEVKRRHREPAKEHHPDRGGDPEEFRRFREAYEAAMKPRGRP
ncbi:J domain-containing protein [Paludisphaera soli]|uniref:J domain-containing protein n=1 Tax=Paludisphaera soli TaxID=2712865 RepID=UPI0019815A6D|nr:J domain-containing protein [Paludisphaera soli]